MTAATHRVLGWAQEGMADIAAHMKAYRPAATVLEAQVAPARRGEGAGCLAAPGLVAAQGPGAFLEVMRLKRNAHDKAIRVCCLFP